MKRNFVIVAITLILTGLLGYPSMSLAQGGAWKKKADMPTARSHLSTAVVNNIIYAVAGWSGVGVAVGCCNQPIESLTTVEAYDPTTDKWTKKADIPTKRMWFSLSVVGGKIYAFGGQTLVDRRGKKIAKTARAIDVYDPVADAWENLGDAPRARMRMSSVALNGKIYVIGVSTAVSDKGTLAQVFDPAQNTWADLAPMPTGRGIGGNGGGTAGVVAGKIYAIGGFTKDAPFYLQSVEEYDPATDTWQKKKDMPTGRDYLSPTTPAVGGLIYVIGGCKDLAPLKTVEEYDPAKNEWTQMNKMSTARMGVSVSAVRGKLYAIGGAGGLPPQPFAAVEEYTPPGWPFAVSPQGKLATMWGTIKTVD